MGARGPRCAGCMCMYIQKQRRQNAGTLTQKQKETETQYIAIEKLQMQIPDSRTRGPLLGHRAWCLLPPASELALALLCRLPGEAWGGFGPATTVLCSL
jgi:hypothetical protein